MSFTWNYGKQDEILSIDALNELKSAVANLNTSLKTSVGFPTINKESVITSINAEDIRDAIDSLEDYNYCRTYYSSRNSGVLSSRDTSALNSENINYDGRDGYTRYSSKYSSNDSSAFGSDNADRLFIVLSTNLSAKDSDYDASVQGSYRALHDDSDNSNDDSSDNSSNQSGDDRADNGGLSHSGDNSDNAGCQSR